MAQPVLGTSASAVWLWFLWHSGFPILVALYAATADRRRRVIDTTPLAICVAICVAASTLMVTVGLPWLPDILDGTSYGAMNRLRLGPTVLVLNAVALAVVAVRLRARTTLHLWLTVALVAANVDVWLTTLANGRFTLGWYFGRICSLLTGLLVLLTLLRELTVIHLRLDEAMRRLRVMAHSDGLTGLANRYALNEAIEREQTRALRTGQPLSVLLLDIDYFKLFNDRYGHLIGDACLRRVARQIEERIRRPTDLAARYGGEEFVVLLPNTHRSGALLIAERIRRAVHEMAIPHESAPLRRVTISIGIATSAGLTNDAGDDGLLAAADAALYVSKQNGRNRVSEAA
jgi:diguanylate cyclase (GGDEF)-like protein